MFTPALTSDKTRDHNKTGGQSMFTRKWNHVPWEKEYRVFGIPRSLKPYPDKPACHILDTAAKKFKKTGAIQYNFKMTYPLSLIHI